MRAEAKLLMVNPSPCSKQRNYKTRTGNELAQDVGRKKECADMKEQLVAEYRSKKFITDARCPPL